MPENSLNKYHPYLLFICSVILQFILLGKYINSNVMSDLHPFFGDSNEYADSLKHWVTTGDFVSTFNSGLRLPGYVSFMLLCYRLAIFFSCNPFIFIRIIQLILSAFIPFFSYKAIFNFTASHGKSLLGGIITCLYFPFYYFVPAIAAESVSLFFIAILMYQISFVGIKNISIKNIFFIAVNIALLTYFKPNHILFLIPVGILLINKNQFFSVYFFSALIKPSVLILLVVVFMLPWVIFISTQNKMFIPLSTPSGINMVIGTGIALNGNPDTTTLTYKYEKKYNLIADTVFVSTEKKLSIAEMNKIYQKNASTIWKHRPWITFKYGLIKIAHSIGLGFRGLKDYLSFLLIIPALLIICLSKKFRYNNRNLVILTAVLFILSTIQMFIYFGDMRFRILMIDMPFVYIISIFGYNFYIKVFGKAIK